MPSGDKIFGIQQKVHLKSQQGLDWLQLMLCANDIGIEQLKRLTEVYESLDDIVRAGRRKVAEIVGKEASQRLFSEDKRKEFDEACRWLSSIEGADVVTWSDPDYPKELLVCGKAPSVLFLRGRRELLARRRFYLTGTQHPDAEGKLNAASFGEAIAQREVLLTGLEAGIEREAAAAAAASCGAVVVVQATGPDRLYPSQCRDLFHQIADSGLVVSPFVPCTGFSPENVAVQRRICMQMCSTFIVVQAEIRSEALKMAQAAAESAKDVYTIPGSIHCALYKGNHKLLREGAGLVESIHDLGL